MIPPIILLVVFLILIGLLRAVVAPLVLIGTVILSFLAALGVGYFVFDVIFGFPGSDPSLPLFAFVFLVALGVDYNIFLIARAREETEKHGSEQGILRALAVTGGVITSAGIVLAGTFSVLAVLPLTFLTELGFVVAFGVLLDTFLVRSVLVPAIALSSATASGGPRRSRARAPSSARPGAPQSANSRTSSRTTRPPTSARPSPSGRAWSSEPRPWWIVSVAAERGAEHDRRRAGRLVLADPVLEREAARAHRARPPRPAQAQSRRSLRARGGGPSSASTSAGVAELDQLPGRRPLGPGGDEGQLALARAPRPRPPAAAAPRRGCALLRQQPGGADRRVAGEGQLQPGREDPASAPRSRSSTKTVSEKPSSAATAWRRSSGTSAPSRKTPSGLPHWRRPRRRRRAGRAASPSRRPRRPQRIGRKFSISNGVTWTR